MLYNIDKNYLLEEMTKWKEKYRDGHISEKGLKNIKNSGIAKNESQLAAGVDKGTLNLMKKQAPDYKINSRTKLPLMHFMTTGGAYMDPSTRTINSDSLNNPLKKIIFPFAKSFPTTKNNQTNDLSQALALRHEAYEAIDSSRRPYPTTRPDGVFQGKFSGKRFGNHMSADILNKEAKDVNDLKYTNASKIFTKVRQNSGELDAMKNQLGIDYTKVTNSNVGKNTKKIKAYETYNGNYTVNDAPALIKQAAIGTGLVAGTQYLQNESDV